jgi:hypothetical protein
MIRLLAIASIAAIALFLLGGCVDYFQADQQAQTASRSAEQQAAALSRWDLYLNSRIDELTARTAILELAASRPGCHLR